MYWSKDISNKIKEQIPNLFILSSTTIFTPINDAVIYFNKKVEDYYNGERYINIFPTILKNIDKYLNYSFKYETEYPEYKHYDFDPIHLGNNCNHLLFDILSKKYELIFKDVGFKKCNRFKSCYLL